MSELFRGVGCKAVVFDLFQTLIPIGQGLPLRTIFCHAAGIDEESFLTDWRELYVLGSTGKYPGVYGAIREFAHKLGLALDESRLTAMLEERTDRHHYGFRNIDPEIPKWLRLVTGSGLRTALLSNSDSEIVAPFPASPLNGLFDVTVFSHEAGFAKPDPAIFNLVCHLLDFPPEQCLFVGDGANNEFRGARTAGMKTALVMRYASASRRKEWGTFCDVVVEDLAELAEGMVDG